MGLFYPAQATGFTNSVTRARFDVGPGLLLESVLTEWTPTLYPDVFVSHQHNDLQRAKHAAEVLQNAGVSAYVDHYDPQVTTDGPHLESYLRDVIRGTKALLVIATVDAKESWWVGFEIGAAREAGKLLSSRIDRDKTVRLPTYLEIWPVITSDNSLREWAQDVQKYAGSKYKVDEVFSYLRSRYRW